MHKYILFDLDGTILDFNKGERDAFIKTIGKYSDYILKESDIKEFSKINDYYFNEFSKGNMDRPTFHYTRFKKIFDLLNIDSDPKIANAFYVETLKYEAQVYDDFKDIIDYLYNKYDLYVASNGMTIVQEKRMEIANINHYFKKIYISENLGFNKPDVRFFEGIMNDLNDYDKSKYIIIGDRLDSDILGGINFGIDTILINRNNLKIDDVKPNIVINSLEELKKYL